MNIKMTSYSFFYESKKTTIFCFFFTLFSCNSQSTKTDNCKLQFKAAKDSLNAYYRGNEESLLQSALENVERSIRCDEIRDKSIELKISLLILLKKYKIGYMFIDSLRRDDFKASYKKKMNYNYFLVLEHESKGDTTNRDKLLNEIISDI
jgi:hypothetical protein